MLYELRPRLLRPAAYLTPTLLRTVTAGDIATTTPQATDNLTDYAIGSEKC